ncbi:hypothetical protein QR680_009771 [Steinernema hermaphroditum]|uniref:Inositol oxygenase n=1 Tax=Steinernema hermaphroditum TaxID=289476 RepID=A0AA39MAC9_9BILA|nr:hypothetical protein QR680_009771 [Steinernema hermaphroditum]
MVLLDEKVVPEEPAVKKDFRVYDATSTDPIQIRVREHYRKQHRFQTVDFVRQMHKKWLGFSHASLTVMECLDLLNNLVDESDPDVDDANLVHAYQTAESLRAAYPEKPWLHLAGLVHDLGKVMSCWGEEQWAVTGDTYPVGCRPVDSIVYGLESFKENEDLQHEVYSSRNGMYEEGCGVENLLMTWSHDEYLYRVLVNHGTTLPDDALYAIRFHSFYPYHNSREYTQFETARDRQLLPAILELNSCDLYSKSEERPDIEALRPYYQSLIDQYIPGVVHWDYGTGVVPDVPSTSGILQSPPMVLSAFSADSDVCGPFFMVWIKRLLSSPDSVCEPKTSASPSRPSFTSPARRSPVAMSSPAVSPTSSADSSLISITSARSACLYEWARTRRRSSCVSISSSLNDSFSRFQITSKTDIKEGNDFLTACTKGDVEKVRKMLEAKKLLVNYVEPFMHNYTPLHYAAKKGDLEVVKILVENGANINAFTTVSCPLVILQNSSLFTVIRFLEKQPGVKLGLHDGDGRTFEDCWKRPEGKRNIEPNDAGKKKVSFRTVDMSTDFLKDLQKSDLTQKSLDEEEEMEKVKKKARGPRRLLRKILM